VQLPGQKKSNSELLNKQKKRNNELNGAWLRHIITGGYGEKKPTVCRPEKKLR
jgi:hypothetical protein